MKRAMLYLMTAILICTMNVCVGGKVILPSLGKDFFTSVGKQFFT